MVDAMKKMEIENKEKISRENFLENNQSENELKIGKKKKKN